MIAAARQIADAFKQTYEADQPLDEIIALLDKLVQDEEQSVRMVVMEQIPEIVLYCQQVGEPLKYVIEEELVPRILVLLGDRYSQVRKVAQTGVVTLVERGVVSSTQLEEKFFPVILKPSELLPLDDHRSEIEVITFMCKMAPVVGKEGIVKAYLSSFCLSCEDAGFQVRRVCAMGMAEMAPVIGPVLTEKALLPRFLTLCDDEIWGVRKSCAEAFATVARVCSHTVRRKCLAQAFVNLLEDQSRWVRLTAFQTLGQLIATFLHDGEEETDSPALPDELEQNFLLEMKRCMKIVMEKRNQELVEFNSRKAAMAEAESAVAEKENGKRSLSNGSDEVQFSSGSGDGTNGERPGSERAPDPFDDEDEEDDPYEWQSGSQDPPDQKEYSWLLDRSFGPGPDRDWGGEEDWGDVPMDCSDETDPINQRSVTSNNAADEDDGFGEWRDAVTLIPAELDLGIDEEGLVTRDRERGDKGEDKTDVDGSTEVTTDTVPPEVVTSDPPDVRKPETELDLPPSQISVSREEKEDRVQIHVGTAAGRCTLSPTPSTSSSGIGSLCGTDTSSYNTFQYWRLPIPDLELDIDVKDGRATNVHVRAKVKDRSNRVTYSSELNVSIRMNSGQQSGPETQKGVEVLVNGTKEVNDQSTGEEKMSLTCPGRSNSCEMDDMGKNVTVLLESSESDAENVGGGVVGVSQDVHRSYYNLYSVSNPPNNERSSVIEVKYQKKIEPNDRDDSDDDYYNDRFCSEMSRTENLPYIVRAHGQGRGCGDQGRLLPTLQTVSTVQDQDVVPAALLKHYLSMADVHGDNSPVENEMPVFCAYTFPAVVITLGGQHWSILRECFEKLATMFQWKIRYTLGSCLHEIARVIGPELTERDLLPFYDAITKDIDEVRSGILAHIAKFTRILRGEARYCVLDTLNSFLRTDNKNNWRFRYELSVQIEELTSMYDAEDVHRHLCPMALELANDPIADVRRAALRVITEQVKKLNEVKSWEERSGGNLLREFLMKLVEQFGHSTKWVQRQSFANLSGQLLIYKALEPTQFAQDILPHLISLSTDKVPNIRLTVAQTLTYDIMRMAYFADPSNPHNSILVDTITKLQNDPDGDVRFYSGGMRSSPKSLKESAAAAATTLQANSSQNASAQ